MHPTRDIIRDTYGVLWLIDHRLQVLSRKQTPTWICLSPEGVLNSSNGIGLHFQNWTYYLGSCSVL